MRKKFKIGVDVGGTFTDLVVMDTNSNLLCLSKSPTNINNPENAIISCIQKAANHLDVTKEYLLQNCEKFVHGTTAATNALLTNKGAKIGLLKYKNSKNTTPRPKSSNLFNVIYRITMYQGNWPPPY
mgnify:CR=1 FL=1